MKNLVSVADLTPNDILKILDSSKQFETGSQKPYGYANGKVLGLIFLQDSLRTSASLKSAMLRLGGGWIDFDLGYVKSGEEDLEDSVRAVAPLVDVLAMRGPSDIDIRPIARQIQTPIVNGMIGMEHSIGALWYAYTLQQRLGKAKDLTIGMYGMTRYSRPSHSVYRCFSKLGAHFYEDSIIPEVGISDAVAQEIQQNGGQLERAKLRDFIGKVDYLFVAEGLPVKGADEKAVQRFNQAYTPFNKNLLSLLRKDAVFAYCMPRALTDGRLAAEKDVDIDPRNISYEMMEKSVYANMGILAWLLG